MVKDRRSGFVINGPDMQDSELPKRICDMRTSAGKGWEETQANARLIANAPDLLKALKWMTDEFLGHVSFNPEGGDADCFHAYINQARIIIEKAEGGH